MDAYLDAKRDKPSIDSMRAICRILRPAFGDLEPEHVTQAAVNRHARARLAAGRSNSTVVSDLLILRSAVSWAVKQGLTKHRLTFEMPIPRSPARQRWLSKEEAGRLVAACRAPHVRLFVLIALTCGVRRDAILELTWDRVDFGNRTLDFGPGCGNKRRPIGRINDRLMPDLVEASKKRTTPWVIEYGGDRVRDIRTGLEAAAERAGIGHVHPHLFRHTACTWAVMAGESYDAIARMVGATAATIERVYGHHHPEYLRGPSDATLF